MPRTGYSTQEDPIGVAGGVNLYEYAGGDPVNRSDPFGLCPYSGSSRSIDLSDCPTNSFENRRLLTAATLMLSDRSGAGKRSLEIVAANSITVFGTDGAAAICQGSNGCNFGRAIFLNVGMDRSDGAVGALFTHEGRHSGADQGELAATNASLDFYDNLPSGQRTDRVYNMLSQLRRLSPSEFGSYVEEQRRKYAPNQKP
jgi:uncharacterized protein RhaS with RHS repeats